MLTNPHYVGDLVQGRRTTVSITSKVREGVPKNKQIITEGAYHPIISRDDFEAVQQYMQGRKRQVAKPRIISIQPNRRLINFVSRQKST
ncbi:recombinase family protein [Paenibacillus polymyxa]|uniref:recombinase family protein n=1 Tax=Paenibacillus polymyxa TaxID=1406 RepID=UPI0039FCC403